MYINPKILELKYPNMKSYLIKNRLQIKNLESEIFE